MKLQTLLERVQQAVAKTDGNHSRTDKYLKRLLDAAAYEELLSLDVTARTSKKATGESFTLAPID